jgi:hypothetical protein
MPNSPRDLAGRMAGRRVRQRLDDGFVREQFAQPRETARQTARAFLERFPKQAYMNCPTATSNSPCGGCERRIDMRTGDYLTIPYSWGFAPSTNCFKLVSSWNYLVAFPCKDHFRAQNLNL